MYFNKKKFAWVLEKEGGEYIGPGFKYENPNLFVLGLLSKELKKLILQSGMTSAVYIRSCVDNGSAKPLKQCLCISSYKRCFNVLLESVSNTTFSLYR